MWLLWYFCFTIISYQKYQCCPCIPNIVYVHTCSYTFLYTLVLIYNLQRLEPLLLWQMFLYNTGLLTFVIDICIFSNKKAIRYRIQGIIHRRKVSRITFFTIVREKTFAIQAVSYIKIPAEIKSARKYSRMLPDLQNSWTFSSADDSQYTVYIYTCNNIVQLAILYAYSYLKQIFKT